MNDAFIPSEFNFLPAAAYELYVVLPHWDIKSLNLYHIWSSTSSFRLPVVFFLGSVTESLIFHVAYVFHKDTEKEKCK